MRLVQLSRLAEEEMMRRLGAVALAFDGSLGGGVEAIGTC
jgi:hypothetical protein